MPLFLPIILFPYAHQSCIYNYYSFKDDLLFCIKKLQFSAQAKISCSIVLKQYSLHLVHRPK